MATDKPKPSLSNVPDSDDELDELDGLSSAFMPASTRRLI
jgi:hypothetical protein